MLLVFGQKAFGISQLMSVESSIVQSYSVQSLCEITEASDLILDALWLMYRDPSCLKIAFITAHNAVILYSVMDGSVSAVTYHSEVSCILYPLMFSTLIHKSSTPFLFRFLFRCTPHMKLPFVCHNNIISRFLPDSFHSRYSARVVCIGGDACDLVVASGTVFNKILLWHLGDMVSMHPARVKVNLTLGGHEVRRKPGLALHCLSVYCATSTLSLVYIGSDLLHQVW